MSGMAANRLVLVSEAVSLETVQVVRWSVGSFSVGLRCNIQSRPLAGELDVAESIPLVVRIVHLEG
jgi:hypothetical protein